MDRWPVPCLMLVTDRTRLRGRSLEDVARAAVRGGANVVQLREKDLPDSELTGLATKLRAALRGRALLLVNSSARVAGAIGADGVHLPEQGINVADARAAVGDGGIVGRSVHSVEAARRAEADGADFVQVGAVYETASKAGQAPAGLDLVREAVAVVQVPVVAVGGITADNASDVIAAGASGVAVIGAVMDADDPERAAAALRAAIRR